MHGHGAGDGGSRVSSARASGPPSSFPPPCLHYAEYDDHGDPVALPDPAPGVRDQWMRIVLAVDAHARDGWGFHGFNVRPGAQVHALPGTVVVHTYAADPRQCGRSAAAFQLDERGTWVCVAQDAGYEWAISIRDRVRALIAARECTLCSRMR